MDKTEIQIKLRMNRGFHRELLRSARRNERTLNAEILARLGAVHTSNVLPETAQRELLRQMSETFLKATQKAYQRFKAENEAEKHKPITTVSSSVFQGKSEDKGND